MFKKLLVNSNITQDQLAERLNVTQALISKWVTGKCAPRTPMLSKIAVVLRVDVSEVVACFTNDEEKKMIGR